MFGSEGFEAAAVLQGDIAAAVVRTSECDVGGLFAFQLYFADQLALRIYNGYRSFVVAAEIQVAFHIATNSVHAEAFEGVEKPFVFECPVRLDIIDPYFELCRLVNIKFFTVRADIDTVGRPHIAFQQSHFTSGVSSQSCPFWFGQSGSLA